METYGGEDEFIRKSYNGKERRRMANGDGGGKISLDTILKISQALIIPLLLAMFYLLVQINALDRRFVTVESQLAAFPKLDVLIGKLAVIEDRQNRNVIRVDALELEFQKHRELSTYDVNGYKRIPRER